MNKWMLLSLGFAMHTAQASSFAFADVLFWQVRESNATNWAQELTPSAAHETIRFFEVPFKYTPGLRVGGGYQRDHSPWVIEAFYTGYKTQGTNQAHTDSSELHPSFSSNFYANNPAGNGISGPYYHHAAIQWDVDFDSVDVVFGRTIAVDSQLRLKPFWGIKAARIYQTIQSQWQEPFEPTTQPNQNPTPITTFSSATETITNRFRGIGPSMGLDSSWQLLDGKHGALALIANASGAWLWSSWHFSDVYQNNMPQTISTQSEPLSSSALMAQAFLGLELTGVVHASEWGVRLGYEEQAWFNQLQYYSFDMGKTDDTLYLQGAVLGFNINF